MRSASDSRLVPLRDSIVGRVLHGSGGTSYYVRECIGEGGQGWVFRANWDDPSGHVVIVKVLRPDVIATEALRRFEREAEVLRMLSTQGRPNPYIVRFFDHAIAQVPSPYGPEPITLPFTVLEYVDGTTLEKVLTAQRESGRGMSADRVRRLLRQICQALDAVHEKKIVHRDLKPSNILLANEAGTEIARVTDFGLVKLVDVKLDKTAALAGASLGYAPPEQYEKGNQRVSPRTDVFSLAAVVYEMLTGKPAFPFTLGENPLLIVTRILTGPRPSLTTARRALASELSSTAVEALDRELSRAMSADPGARHETAGALFRALEPALRSALDTSTAAPSSQVSAFDTTVRASRAAPPSAPDAWTWSVLTPALANTSIRSVAFTRSADAAIALTASELLRWEHGAWVPVSLPAHVPRASLRGLRWMPDGSVLLYGAGGFVARHVLGATTTPWRVPDPEITFLGALAEDNGTTTLIGQRPLRGAPRGSAGVVAQFNGDRITVVGDAMSCARLSGVARLADGQLVACGGSGSIVRIELGIVEFVGSICGGHLLAIAPLPEGGAVTVGAGGHALALGPKLEAQLEAVQTTRDLRALATSDVGEAWAGGAQARIVRRSSVDARENRWVRMNLDLPSPSTMLALAVTRQTVRAIAEDGTVVEGRLA